MTLLQTKDNFSSVGTSALTPFYQNVDKPTVFRSYLVYIQSSPLPTTNASDSEPSYGEDLLARLGQTTGGLTDTPNYPKEETRKALNEIKKISGLTWEQIAKLFNVSRRSIYFWASGKPLASFNEEFLYQLLVTMRYINQGSADATRKALLSPAKNDLIPFNLLIEGKCDEVKKLIGAGKEITKPTIKPLSKEASQQRTPLPPEELVGATHDPVHREVRKSRPAKAARRRESGQAN